MSIDQQKINIVYLVFNAIAGVNYAVSQNADLAQIFWCYDDWNARKHRIYELCTFCFCQGKFPSVEYPGVLFREEGGVGVE